MATRAAGDAVLIRVALLVVVALVVAACGGSATGPGQATARTTALGNPADTPSPSVGGSPVASGVPTFEITEYTVPAGSHPHDVAPAADGGVWYTAQNKGVLGHLNLATGEVRETRIGDRSAPHGVIVGPDGAPWITDAGLNAIVRVDPATLEATIYSLPADRAGANLNTAVFDATGAIWFTGQGGVYGVLNPATRQMRVFDAPEGRGPYGITITPDGTVWYASLAGSHIARIDPATGQATVVEPPTANQGARRVWSDSKGRVWVSEWNSGQVSVHDPASGNWRSWKVPGANPQIYAVYVDDQDIVWLTDFGANAIVRFDPVAGMFTSLDLPTAGAAVRQLLGRPGEVWGAESAVDKLVLIRQKG